MGQVASNGAGVGGEGKGKGEGEGAKAIHRSPFAVCRSPSCARACMATVQARSPAMRDRASEQKLKVLIVMPLSLGEGPEGM